MHTIYKLSYKIKLVELDTLISANAYVFCLFLIIFELGQVAQKVYIKCIIFIIVFKFL